MKEIECLICKTLVEVPDNVVGCACERCTRLLQNTCNICGKEYPENYNGWVFVEPAFHICRKCNDDNK